MTQYLKSHFDASLPFNDDDDDDDDAKEDSNFQRKAINVKNEEEKEKRETWISNF